jgi:hypothetical protein
LKKSQTRHPEALGRRPSLEGRRVKSSPKRVMYAHVFSLHPAL